MESAMKFHSTFLFVGMAWMNWFCPGSAAGAPGNSPAENSGVVVQSVARGSESDHVGLHEGDTILGWNRGPISGSIRSPFDLAEVEIEQVPRGTVRLQGIRGTEKFSWTLGPSPLGADVRPVLPDQLLAMYRQAEKLALDGQQMQAAAQWRALARDAKYSWLRAGFLSKAGESLAGAQDWTGVDEAYRSAVQHVKTTQASAAAQLLEKWAAAYEAKKDWTSAARYYRRAWLTNERSNPGSLSVANDLQHLAWIARQQRTLPLVARYATMTYAIRRRQAPGSLVLAVTLDHLAGVAWDKGDLAGVERVELQALSIRSKLLPESREVARVLSNLGAVALQRGDLTKAEGYHRQALAVEQKLAPDSLNVAIMLNNLGLIAADRGDLAEAENLHHRALAIREKLAPDSRDLAMSLGNLGLVAESRGDLTSAEQYGRRALAIEEKLA